MFPCVCVVLLSFHVCPELIPSLYLSSVASDQCFNQLKKYIWRSHVTLTTKWCPYNVYHTFVQFYHYGEESWLMTHTFKNARTHLNNAVSDRVFALHTMNSVQMLIYHRHVHALDWSVAVFTNCLHTRHEQISSRRLEVWFDSPRPCRPWSARFQFVGGLHVSEYSAHAFSVDGSALVRCRERDSCETLTSSNVVYRLSEVWP